MNQTNSLKTMRLALIAAGLMAVTATTYAASTSNTFQVSANVNAQCSVTATAMAFGDVDPMGAAVLNTSTISVKCTKRSSYNIGLNAGTTPTSTVPARKMASANGNNDTMAYELFSDSTRLANWGDATPSWVGGTGIGMGTAVDHIVYGRVPAGQNNLAVGAYLESAVTVTVTY